MNDLRDTRIRWICLFFFCLSTFGSYFTSDLVMPLQSTLLEYFELDNTQFNCLHTFSGLSASIIPLFGGLLIDKTGIRFSFITFAFLTIVASGSMVLALTIKSFRLLLLGKVLIKVGQACLFIAKTTIVTRWFQKRDLAFAMGITISFSRLGTSFSEYSAPILYGFKNDITTPFLFGTLLCLVSFGAVILVCLIDWYADKSRSNKAENAKDFHFKQVFSLPKLYYLLSISCVFSFTAIMCFLINGADMMVKRFGYSLSLAGSRLAIVHMIGAIASPINGAIADKYGRRPILISISAIFLAGSLTTLLFLKDEASSFANNAVIIPLVGIGICYSIYSAVIWPCFSLVTNKALRGTAYGLVSSLENGGIAIFALINGWIHDRTIGFHQGYFWPIFLLLLVSLGALYVSVKIYFEDKRTGMILHQVSNKKCQPKDLEMKNLENYETQEDE